ncbi:MAG: response regulator [Spirosomataceae bacterium]
MLSKVKVLIVDDEPNILMSLEFLMKKEGYRVFIARDGEEAFDIIKSEVPDVVLLDIMMPKVDGYQVCQFIKSTPEYTHSKVIFMSAKSKEGDVKKGFDLGADMYISKPFSTRDLLSKVNTMALSTI